MLCHLGLHKLMGGPLVLKRVQYNMWFLRRGVWDWLTPGPASAVGGGLGVLVPLAPGPACALVPLVAQLAWLRRSASRDEEAPCFGRPKAPPRVVSPRWIQSWRWCQDLCQPQRDGLFSRWIFCLTGCIPLS